MGVIDRETTEPIFSPNFAHMLLETRRVFITLFFNPYRLGYTRISLWHTKIQYSFFL